MEEDASSYFKLAFHQLRCAPRLIIPFLIAESLSYTMILTGIFFLVLFSLPVLGKIIPVLEGNQDLISKIMTEEGTSNITEIQGLEKAFSGLIPEMLYLFIIFMLIYILIGIIYFLLYSWARAGTIGYAWQGVTSTLDFRNFIFYAGQGMYRIAGLWILIIAFSIILFLIPFSTLVLIPSPVNIIAFILSFLLFFILWVIAMFLLIFTEECIVIENKGIMEAIKRSKEIASGNLENILVFTIIAVAVFIIFFIVSGVFDFLAGIFNSSASAFFTLISLVILTPWIQLAKLDFFLDRTGRTVIIMEKEIEIIKTAKEFVRESPQILVNFVRNNITYVLAALFFYWAGFGMGYYLGHPLSFLGDDILKLMSQLYETRSIGPYNSMPVIDFIGYFSNNSLVGINTGLGGLFLGVPSILGIVVTGVVTGLFYGIFPAKVATAFLAVHGILEVTGFVIVAAAGIRLGVGFIKGLPDRYDLVDETLKVVPATLLLIAIAAFLEAFITPIVISLLV